MLTKYSDGLNGQTQKSPKIKISFLRLGDSYTRDFNVKYAKKNIAAEVLLMIPFSFIHLSVFIY